MKSKQFHFESHDGKFYTALFSLTKVDDKEVYEFLAKEEEATNFLHYGYMTEAFMKKLLSNRADGVPYIQGVSLRGNYRDIPQKQKIILDLPDKIDEKSFLPGGLPFQSASLTLYSKSYQDKLAPAVTIKPHSSFNLDTNESTVIFKFPNNEMECTNFMVGEFAEGSHNTIDLNVENSKAEEIIIQGVRPISSINNETYLWIKNKERELIYVYGVLLPSNVEKKEALFNEGVSYIPISANGAIRLYHVKIEADLNTITSCGIYSGGKIEVSDGDLAFGRGTSILQVGEGLSVENMKLVISGDNNIERSLSIETDSSFVKNDSLTIENVYSKNNLYYTKGQGGDKINAIVAKSSFDNAGYPIYLSGDVSIYDTNIKNEKREGKNSLTILDCFFVSCDFYNISNMNNARVNNARLENFTLENENENDRNAFYFGLSDPLSMIKLEEHPFEISNSTVSLGENDVFHFYPDDSEKKIQINNSNFTGKFELAAPGTLKINIKNSIFNNTNIEIGSVPKVDIENSEINGELKTTKNQSYSEIKDFISRDSTLSDVSGTLTGSINSVKGEEITIKEGGQFNILPANAQETGVDTYLSSLTIEEGSELSIGANGVDKKTISLNNVKVSNGNNIVVFSQDTTIDNTQLNSVELSIEKNDSGKFQASNSTLANKIVLKNVSSVNLSEIDSSNLSSSTVVAIENEWIKDRITNILDEILERKKKGITFEDNSLILKTDKNLELL